ncbi:MAG: cytochrome c [Myxococcales bacterium]|nr:cytochrome c [Myxococcales bacterium]
MRPLIAAAAILIAAVASQACGESDADKILALSGNSANGGTVYTAQCAVCHMADGTGNADANYPSLVEHAMHESDMDIVEVILEGEGAMPEFRSKLSDQEIADLLAYIRATFG